MRISGGLALAAIALLTAPNAVSAPKETMDVKKRELSKFMRFIPPEDILKPCGNKKIDHHFEVTMKASNDPDMISFSVFEYDIDKNGKEKDRKPYKFEADPGHGSTPLNFNLGLNNSTRKNVEIHLILDNSTSWHFAGNELGVTSHDQPDQKEMFCRGINTTNNSTLGVKYWPKPKKNDPKNYAFYNVNIVIPLGSKMVLPITLDPEVKNEG